MRIKYFAHAAFLMVSEQGTRVITDPYQSGDFVKYREVTEPADAVTVSHSHGDHNNPGSISGKPVVINQPGIYKIKDFTVTGTAVFHDEKKGSQRGNNIIFCIEADGVRVCHLGDLGHKLDKQTLDSLGKVDVLLVPVGGLYTIDAAGAGKVIEAIKPKIIIPMHYRTEKSGFGLGGLDSFVSGMPEVQYLNASEMQITGTGRLEASGVVVLEPGMS